jgi:hypothetical protein
VKVNKGSHPRGSAKKQFVELREGENIWSKKDIPLFADKVTKLF